MNKIFPIILLLLAATIWTSCEKGIEINDDYKDITIVYGLINPNDSVSYLRIEKAFLSNGDIYQDALNPDSNLYSYKLDVKILADDGSRTIEFDTITIYNKEDGIFYSPKMVVYYAVTKNLLDKDKTYNLEITNPKTGDFISSSTGLVDGSRINFGYPNFSVSFINDKSVTFRSIKGARLYQLNIRFHYTEGLLVRGDTIFSEHYSDWLFPGITSRSLDGGEEMAIPYIGNEFYTNLLNTIPVKENVFRYSGQAEFILSMADDIFNIYMDINKPSTSIVLDRPAYTNIENGYGIFASRSFFSDYYGLNLLSIGKLREYESLNFVQRPIK
ncbi:MAG: DUF4249 family protein [Bacteroidales bacterium]|nr:DUF4249 family protein [Bacteroidales bacterium]